MENNKSLFDKATAASKNAYAPYSKFNVGATLITTSGKVYNGCNVENASYGLTICAERNAIFHAVAEEGPGMQIASIAVDCSNDAAGFPPCGACRQVILEFSPKDKPTLVIYKRNGEMVSDTIDKLLPASFSL